MPALVKDNTDPEKLGNAIQQISGAFDMKATEAHDFIILHGLDRAMQMAYTEYQRNNNPANF